MAEAVVAKWGPCEGIVITRYGHARPCQGIEIVEAGHPEPDAAGMAASARMLDLLHSLDADDFVLALISGGASALLTLPRGDITLAEKQAVTASLLESGAPISQMNMLRKHLSRVKGGQLAAAAFPARMLALVISDVPGDDLRIIGSGPTVGDTSTVADALGVLQRWNINAPPSVIAALHRPARVIAPNDPRLSHVQNRIIAAPSQSLEAAANWAAPLCDVRILGDAIEGEARDIAAQHAALAQHIKAAHPKRAVLLLSGGEVTVTRRSGGDLGGIGGPNAEYALALAIALNGAAGIHALACDTDGIDGGAAVAGAIIGPKTPILGAQLALDRHDAHGFFAHAGGQVITGPTLTNVNDFRALLICP
jgi:hydroxypyruvate reductase